MADGSAPDQRFSPTSWLWCGLLALWFVVLWVGPDPRPLGAPDWAVDLASLLGLSEPAARAAATLALRVGGLALLGALLMLIVLLTGLCVGGAFDDGDGGDAAATASPTATATASGSVTPTATTTPTVTITPTPPPLPAEPPATDVPADTPAPSATATIEIPTAVPSPTPAATEPAPSPTEPAPSPP